MRKVTDGPLKAAIYAAQSAGEHEKAVNAYRENLAAAFPVASAYRTGGVLFAGVGLILLSLAGIGEWQGVPGAGAGYWLSGPLSVIGGVMSSRASRVLRHAIAGMPMHNP